MNKYIILKNETTPFSKVISDCETGFCFPSRKGDNLSQILKKFCDYISTNKLEEKDPIFLQSPAYSISINNILNWNEAYSWGNHNGLYSPINHQHSLSDITQSGATIGQIPRWNGLSWIPEDISLSSESDPIFLASPAFSISNLDISNWDNSYSWGDHSLVGYLTSASISILSDVNLSGISNNQLLKYDSGSGKWINFTPNYLTSISSSDITTALGYTPLTNTRNITINGTTYDLSVDRTWTIDSLPSQTGNNGKWLVTNGTVASWSNLSGNISLFSNDLGYITSSALSSYLTTAIAASTYVPLLRNININGVSYDLSSDRSWTVGDILSSGSYSNPTWITSLSWSKITGAPSFLTTISGLNNSLLVNDSGFITSTALAPYLTTVSAASTYFPLSGGSINGVGGSGFFGAIAQSSNPAIPSSGFRLFANNAHAFSWVGQNGYIRTFDGTSNTADRSYTLPNLSGTLVLGTGTANEIPYWISSNLIGSLSTVTYPSLTELSYIKGLTSSVQTQIDNTKENHLIKVAQAMGSSVKVQSLGMGMHNIVTANTIGSSGGSRMTLISVYLETTQTITGIRWYQGTSGVYTPNNENRIGLYTVSGGTLTLVASCSNDGTLWSSTSSNNYGSKAFSSTYNANPGLYYIGLLFSNSSASTVPTIGCSTNLVNAAVQLGDFTNGLGMQLIRTTVTTLPSSITASSYNQVQQYYWASLY